MYASISRRVRSVTEAPISEVRRLRVGGQAALGVDVLNLDRLANLDDTGQDVGGVAIVRHGIVPLARVSTLHQLEVDHPHGSVVLRRAVQLVPLVHERGERREAFQRRMRRRIWCLVDGPIPMHVQDPHAGR